MASEFIGYTILVTLKTPPNTQIRGTVASVLGQRLTLQDVTLIWSGQRLQKYHIDATGIADLEVLSNHSPPVPDHDSGLLEIPQNENPRQDHMLPSQERRVEESNRILIAEGKQQPLPQPVQTPFIDPAILSFSRPPSSSSTNRVTSTGPPIQTDSSLVATDATMRSGASLVKPSLSPIGESTVISPKAQSKDSAVTAILTEPFSNLDLIAESNMSGKEGNAPVEPGPANKKDAKPFETSAKYAGRRSRRRGQNKVQKDIIPHAGATGEQGLISRLNTKTKGWRQTAFVEPMHIPPAPSGRQSKEHYRSSYGRRRKRRNHEPYAENPNGWATEDATDIQEMGDFDFQGNLSKFDKRRVFDEIRNDDTTADEDRLISFNKRAARPGTNGGKNLHHTENVLDIPQQRWNSEAGETDLEASGDGKFSSGNYSGRDRSKASTRAQSSRKGSAIPGQTFVATQVSSVARAQLSSSRTASPRPGKQSVTASPLNGLSASSRGSLRLTTTNRSCPTVSPLQMLEIEQLAAAELGLSDDMVTENAGRGIAEAAVTRLSSESAARTMLILTASHRTGARAVCAARHLRNRGHRVSLCMLGLEHESELLENCRKQLDIFRKIGGRVLRWEELSERLSTADLTPDLIIDALFGMHIAFEDLRTDDQAIVFEMISWVNRSNIDILSVDIPSGISATSGEVLSVEGERLHVNSTFVVCLAAPKTGVMQALVSGEGVCWQLTVADIGISQIVWRKYGSRRRHGVDFGNRWVVPLRYQPSMI